MSVLATSKRWHDSKPERIEIPVVSLYANAGSAPSLGAEWRLLLGLLLVAREAARPRARPALLVMAGERGVSARPRGP